MKCHEVRAMLPAYLDRTLSPTERSVVLLHLKECQECQKVLQSFSSVQSKNFQDDEPVKSVKKTGFAPRKSKTKHQDVQTKLQKAGLIAPAPLETIQMPIRENSGEELLRRHMLAILSEEEEKLRSHEIDVEPLDVIEDFGLLEQEELDFKWTREMSLETAMSGRVLEESVEEVELQPTIPFSAISNWQEDPEQYVEIPYIHPVTRSVVLKKVRRNSMEGILFLESEAEKKQEATIIAKEPEIPFETIDVPESGLPVSMIFQVETHGQTAAEIAKARLYQQFSETELSSEFSIKPHTINQTAKVLPFRENSKKQAVLYRFFTWILLIVLGFIILFLWQNGNATALSGAL